MGRYTASAPTTAGRPCKSTWLVQVFAVTVALAVTAAAAANGGLAQRRSTQFDEDGPGLTPTYKCGAGSFEFAKVNSSFFNDFIEQLSTEVTYNLTVVRFTNPAGPFPTSETPTTESIGSVRLIANSPAGSVTVELTNKFGQAWPVGTVVSWASPLYYDRNRCTAGPDRLSPAVPLENVLSSADAADGIKTTISFSLPWYRLSRPQVSLFGEAPCERVTQVAALIVKVFLPPVLATTAPGHRRALQQAGSLADYAGSVAWGGRGTCDSFGYQDEPDRYYPFRIMDLDLACDCDIDPPSCNTGDFELRTPPGIFLPQPFLVNLLHYDSNVPYSNRSYTPELNGYGFFTASGGVLRAKLITKDGSPWPQGSRFSWSVLLDDGSSAGGAPPGGDAPPGVGAPPGEGGSSGGNPTCADPSLTDPLADLMNSIIVTDSTTTEILIEIPTSTLNLDEIPIDGGPDCNGPFRPFGAKVVGALTLLVKAVFPFPVVATAGGQHRRLAGVSSHSHSRGLLQRAIDPDSLSFLGIDALCTSPPVVFASRLTLGCGCPPGPPSPPSPPPMPPRPPPPAESGFPFCRCSHRKVTASPYRVAISREDLGVGTDSLGVRYNEVCFAVGPFARCNATTSACCDMTIKKFELLIRPECRSESPRPVRSIIVNNVTTLSPTFSKHIGLTGEEFTVLGITKLDKVPPKANGSPIIDICIRLATNSFCGYLDGLCDGRGDSRCLYALFGAEDSNCCPKSAVNLFFGRH